MRSPPAHEVLLWEPGASHLYEPGHELAQHREVGIRHQCARHRHRKQARRLHLHHRFLFQPLTPLMQCHRLAARPKNRGWRLRCRYLAA
jgi:hypothetical protein